MSGDFEFGERVDGYDIRVFNERAIRASAGILFAIALIAFMNAWLMGNFQPTRVFVVAFLLDFTMRIFVNPRYAPSLILGQWIVRKQQPEYVGAPQKRFAWAIGFVLALTMFYLVVLKHVIGPVNLVVCVSCLTLLFFETAFGICVGCKIYNLFNNDNARLCPGGICEAESATRSGVNPAQIAIMVAFAVLVGTVTQWIYSADAHKAPSPRQLEDSASATVIDPVEAEPCKVPDFAKAMGHEEKWKLHNHCQ